jgi:hypothetical protein
LDRYRKIITNPPQDASPTLSENAKYLYKRVLDNFYINEEEKGKDASEFYNRLRMFEFLYDYTMLNKAQEIDTIFQQNFFGDDIVKLEMLADFFIMKPKHVIVGSSLIPSTQLEETQATVLRRIHDIGIDDDSSKPAKDPSVDTPYDALIKMIEFKMGKNFEKWKLMKYHKSLQVPLPLLPPLLRSLKEWSLAQQTQIQEKRKKTERRRPSNYGSNNRTERSRNDTNKNLEHPLLNENLVRALHKRLFADKKGA